MEQWNRPSFRKMDGQQRPVQEHAQCTPEGDSTNVPESRKAARNMYVRMCFPTLFASFVLYKELICFIASSPSVIAPKRTLVCQHDNKRENANSQRLPFSSLGPHSLNLPTPSNGQQKQPFSSRPSRSSFSFTCLVGGAASRRGTLFDSYKRFWGHW